MPTPTAGAVSERFSGLPGTVRFIVMVMDSIPPPPPPSPAFPLLSRLTSAPALDGALVLLALLLCAGMGSPLDRRLKPSTLSGRWVKTESTRASSSPCRADRDVRKSGLLCMCMHVCVPHPASNRPGFRACNRVDGWRLRTKPARDWMDDRERARERKTTRRQKGEGKRDRHRERIKKCER